MQNSIIVGVIMKKTILEEIILLEFLKNHFPNSTNNKLRKMLSEGRVLVNNEKTYKAKTILKPKDYFELLGKSNKTPDANKIIKKLKKSSINIIFEDDEIIVVDKPSKLLSVATDRLETTTLHSKCVDYIKEFDNKAWCYIVHRLDKETSGIMLLSKSKQSKEYLQEQFAERSVYRIYHALVEGRPEKTRGTLNQFLVEDKNLNIKAVKPNYPNAKEAITHWEILSGNEETSLIRVMIETGRRHQIRMAMKELGCPIVGDKIHGAETDPKGRICLHASALEFLHPASDDPVRFESPPPFAKLE